jgi:nucleoporin POM152
MKLGSPPFDLTYEEHAKTDDGKSLRKRELNAALGIASIPLDTSKSGQYEYKFIDVSDANYNPHQKSRSNIIVQQQVNPRPTARFTTPGKVYSYCTSETADDSVIPITFTGVPPFDLDVDLRYAGSVAPESITMNNIPTNHYDLRLPRKYLRTGHSHLTIRRVRDGRSCQSKADPSVVPSRIQISVHDPPQIVPLESKTDFCVGERISYRLEGVTPFTVFYTFEGYNRKASSKKAIFRRLAERPGDFVVTGLSDSSSACKFATELQKTIHPLPSVKMSHGRESVVDIHEGGEAEILLEFTGSPPFEFTYTRSETARGGRKAKVLETKTDRTDEFKVRLRTSEEGTYEVISIRDRWCSVSKTGAADKQSDRLLT